MPATPRTRARQPERLLRYSFESATQARRHLHLAEGRQLLFFPDPFGPLCAGQPIQLELCFAATDQTLTVRGEVHAVEAGALRGGWLELYSMRLPDGLQLVTGSRRLFRRYWTDFLVRAERPGSNSSVSRLADVSAGGARLTGINGGYPNEEILLSDLSGGPPLRGNVVWSSSGEVAVAFDRSDVTTRRTAMKLVETAIARWKSALETRHSALCECGRGGALHEPLLPRSAPRRAGVV